jgi:hypothetical protein
MDRVTEKSMNVARYCSFVIMAGLTVTIIVLVIGHMFYERREKKLVIKRCCANLTDYVKQTGGTSTRTNETFDAFGAYYKQYG